MGIAEQQRPAQASHLEQLQPHFLVHRAVAGADLVHAVQRDIADHRVLNVVFLDRFLSRNANISNEQLEELISEIISSMGDVVIKKPEAFLSYAEGAAVCSRELARRRRSEHGLRIVKSV